MLAFLAITYAVIGLYFGALLCLLALGYALRQRRMALQYERVPTPVKHPTSHPISSRIPAIAPKEQVRSVVGDGVHNRGKATSLAPAVHALAMPDVSKPAHDTLEHSVLRLDESAQ